LKHYGDQGSLRDGALSALDPGKQGLKLYRDRSPGGRSGLSALDPGKQGLKQPVRQVAAVFEVFQRLIQENKD